MSPSKIPAFLRGALVLARAVQEPGLFRSVLAYKLAETLYFTYALAYIFLEHGFLGCLIYYLVQSFGIAGGYWHALSWLATHQKWAPRALQGASLGTVTFIALSGALPPTLSVLLLTGASYFIGAAIGVKQWFELTHTEGAGRERYLYLMQASGTLLRVTLMLAAVAGLITLGNQLNAFFVWAGLGGVVLITMAGAFQEATAPSSPPRPLRLLADPRYWKDAPFFAVEAGTAALRTLLGVVGALTVLQTPAAYSGLEIVSAVASAGVAWAFSRRPRLAPSWNRLKGALLVLFGGWVALGVAQWVPPFLLLYVLATALAGPVMCAAYDGLVMISMESPKYDKVSNVVARELILLGARVIALCSACGLALYIPKDTIWVALLVVMLAAIPLEYALARRLCLRAA